MAAPRQDQLFGLFIAVWCGVFTWSIIGLASGDAEPDRLTSGLNRIAGFMVWQFIAAGLSVPVFMIGRSYPRGGALRWMSRVPLALALLLVLAIVSIFVWVHFLAGG